MRASSASISFFLLSPYLLDRQIALAMRHGEQDYWGNYFLRRVLRVYPLFTVALVLHLLLTRLGITIVFETWQAGGLFPRGPITTTCSSTGRATCTTA